jgi:prepilin-type processing-associated H-X9-DG protein
MNFCCLFIFLKSPVNLIVVVLTCVLLTGCGTKEETPGGPADPAVAGGEDTAAAGGGDTAAAGGEDTAAAGGGDTAAAGGGTIEVTREPAKKTSFVPATKHLDAGGSFYMYLSTEEWIESIARSWDDMREMFTFAGDLPGNTMDGIKDGYRVIGNGFSQSGIAQLSGIGLSTFPREKNLYLNKAVFHRYADAKRGKFWDLMGSRSHDLETLRMLPATTAFACFSDFDGQLGWEWLGDMINDSGIPDAQTKFNGQQAQLQSMGIDLDKLIGSIDGQIGVVFTIDESRTQVFDGPDGQLQVPDIALMIVIQVKDSSIYDLATSMVPPDIGVRRTDTAAMKAVTMPIPVPVPIKFEPTLAQSHGYLMLASNADIIDEAMAVLDGNKNGLTTTSEFKLLARDVPTQGVNFHYVSERLGSSIAGIMEQALEQAPDPDNGGVQVAMALVDDAKGFHSYGVFEHREDGFYFTGNASTGVGNIIVIPAVVGPTAILAGMLLPALNQAREKARRMNCAGNLKQIALASIMYAGDDVEHGRFPDNLAQLHEQKYLMNGKVYGCPSAEPMSESAADSNYVYVGAGLKDTNRDPATTVLAYCDPANHHYAWMNVMFVDGHVSGQKAMSIEQAAEQNGWTIGTGQ